jgi:hypothetical protein
MRGGPDLAQHPHDLPALSFSDTINLPGTTDTNQKGAPSSDRSTYSFTQPYSFTGTCWYQRQITVPPAWNGKRVTLFLERTKYTQLWLDNRPVGNNVICCSPQEYELSRNMPAGVHTITVAVNNQRLPPYGADSHQFSGNTQGNWNGIIGKIELRKTDLIWLQDLQIYPDALHREVTFKTSLTNLTDKAASAVLIISDQAKGVTNTALSMKLSLAPGTTEAQGKLSLGPDAPLWDEFHPQLHKLLVRLSAENAQDCREASFGLRDFKAAGQQFTVNGQPVFLRGKHDACVFPLTGHPPMDVQGWIDYLKICQSYGLNHIRFHSWTPPEAAFEAADQLGFYLQPELPFWGGFDEHVKQKLKPEAEQILRSYGNHPSFVMFSMGNENWADPAVLASLVSELKALDPRHLYVRGTNAFSYLGRPGPGDDYLVTAGVKNDPSGPLRPVRGSNGGGPPDQGHVQTGPPNTLAEYSNAIAGTNCPTVTHEMGQYTSFPDFKQIDKYTGVSKPFNLVQIRQNLLDSGMIDQADDFAKASGALAALCYREEIESCLRTPSYGGFELLDLQDYPGQGTALVGILDALMQSKGILTPQQWRQFCSPMVLLAKFPKYSWTSGEIFTADIDLAQYGPIDLHNAIVSWKLLDSQNNVLRAGHLPATDAARGGLRALGKIVIPTQGIVSPRQLRLELSLSRTDVTTQYPLWLYPKEAPQQPHTGVTIASKLDLVTQRILNAGGRVLLIPGSDAHFINSPGGGFASDFWNFTFFHNKPGTMGLLCDPSSPALSLFPAESHSSWQWFPILMQSQPLILDTIFPKGIHPAVQIIDNYERCHKLGLVFEVKVGAGRLLICMADLNSLASNHPEARQLKESLLAYAASDRFHPAVSVSIDTLRDLFRTSMSMSGCKATASSYDHGWQGFKPDQLIDDNDAKIWKPDADAQGDTWCQIEFPSPTDLHGAEIVWADWQPGLAYRIESSTDPVNWNLISDQRHNSFQSNLQKLPLEARAVKFIRITINAKPGEPPPGIGEIRFYPNAEFVER